MKTQNSNSKDYSNVYIGNAFVTIKCPKQFEDNGKNYVPVSNVTLCVGRSKAFAGQYKVYYCP